MKGSLLAFSNSSPPTWKEAVALPTAIAVAPVNTAFAVHPSAAGRTYGAANAATPAAPRAAAAGPIDDINDLPSCSGECVTSGRIFS